jgi:exodeoxyribonuclease VII small subunit
MDDLKYSENIRRIEEIVSQLDSKKPSPEEAKKLFETTKGLILECEATLNRYSGTIEEMSSISTGH